MQNQPHSSGSRSLSKLPDAAAVPTPEAILARSGLEHRIVNVQKNQTIFSQGDAADAVFYIQKGRVRLTVVSKGGKEATIALLNAGDFVGEECAMSIQPLRTTTATGLTACTLLRIEKEGFVRALHEETAFSDVFVGFLIARKVRIQEDLMDQLFHSSEKRLARALLMLAQSGKDGTPETTVPTISQETLAEMVGTTRSRVSCFMNRFRRMGYIDYNTGHQSVLRVHDSLLHVVADL